LTPRGLCVHPCEGDCEGDEWQRSGSDGVHERYSCQQDPFTHLPGTTNKGYFQSPYCGAYSLKNCNSYSTYQDCIQNSSQCNWATANNEPVKMEIKNSQKWWWETTVLDDNGDIKEVIKNFSDPEEDGHQCMHLKGTGESTADVESALAHLAALQLEWFTQCLKNSRGFLLGALGYCMIGCDWVKYNTILEDCLFDACTANNFAQAAESRMQCQANTFRDLPWDQKKCDPGFALSMEGDCIATTCDGSPCNPDREICFPTEGDPTCYQFDTKGFHSEICLEYVCQRWSEFVLVYCEEYIKVKSGWISTKEKCLDKCHKDPSCRGCYRDGYRATKKKCSNGKKSCSKSKKVPVNTWMMIGSAGCSMTWEDQFLDSEVLMKYTHIPKLYYK